MFGSIFNPENKFWQTLDHLADLLILSLLWLLCSLPLVTAGAATTALYDAAAHCLRGPESMPWKRFVQTFRRELLPASLVTVVWGAVLLMLVYALQMTAAAASAGTSAAWAALIFCLVVMILPVGAACWMFPLLSRFAFRPVDLMLTALRLTLGCLPRTIGLVAIVGISALLVRVLLIPIVILPGAAAWLFTLLLEPVFRRYQPDDTLDEPVSPDEEESETQEEEV